MPTIPTTSAIQPTSQETQNVAMAYPRRTSNIPKLLATVLFLGAIVTYFVHKADISAHPFRSAFQAYVASKPALPNSRLAVCYSGHVGTLSHVYKQNLEVIRKVDPSASFFYFLDLQDDYRHENSRKRYTHQHKLSDIQHIFDATEARSVKTFDSDSVPLPPKSDCYKKHNAHETHYSHNYITFYAAAGCYDMIKQAEEELDHKFEWILRLQPNMKIAVKFPSPDLPHRVHMSGAAIQLVPREMADSTFSAVKAFDNGGCRELDAMGDGPCIKYSYDADSTECLLVKWLNKSDIVPSNSVYVNRRIVYPVDEANQ